MHDLLLRKALSIMFCFPSTRTQIHLIIGFLEAWHLKETMLCRNKNQLYEYQMPMAISYLYISYIINGFSVYLLKYKTGSHILIHKLWNL